MPTPFSYVQLHIFKKPHARVFKKCYYNSPLESPLHIIGGVTTPELLQFCASLWRYYYTLKVWCQHHAQQCLLVITFRVLLQRLLLTMHAGVFVCLCVRVCVCVYTHTCVSYNTGKSVYILVKAWVPVL